MSDLVSRSYLLAEYDRRHQGPAGGARKIIEEAPSAETEIIRCKDCKWYDTTEEMKCGYCEAIQHCYHSRTWEINIHRKYPPDFYCADAEPKDEEEGDER